MHPAHFGHVTRDRDVASSRSSRGPGLRLLVVPCGDGAGGSRHGCASSVAQALGEAGADARVEVERCPELARQGGKLQIVRAQPG